MNKVRSKVQVDDLAGKALRFEQLHVGTFFYDDDDDLWVKIDEGLALLLRDPPPVSFEPSETVRPVDVAIRVESYASLTGDP
jgi:hypothetical protein